MNGENSYRIDRLMYQCCQNRNPHNEFTSYSRSQIRFWQNIMLVVFDQPAGLRTGGFEKLVALLKNWGVSRDEARRPPARCKMWKQRGSRQSTILESLFTIWSLRPPYSLSKPTCTIFWRDCQTKRIHRKDAGITNYLCNSYEALAALEQRSPGNAHTYNV